MFIGNDVFKIKYEEEESTIYFSGTIRMYGNEEYLRIRKFLSDIYELENHELLLNFVNLDFMSSSGISTIAKFFLHVKDKEEKDITIIGNKNIVWQKKSIDNLKSLNLPVKVVY